jgi:curved DNA-binding protein CbpA
MRKLPTLDMSGDTYYAVLGIPETATQDQIKRAYRRLIKRVHPDKFPNASSYWKRAVEQESKKVIEAYYVLSDSTQRLSYDRQLASYRQQHAPTPSPRPKAATTSPPRSYTSQPNPRPQARAAVRRSWASWAFLAGILFLASAVLLGYVFSGSNDFQPSKSKAAFAAGTEPASGSPGFPSSSSSGFEDHLQARMIKRFCNENKTSSYHFFASSVLLSGSCSDWLRQNQSSVEGGSVKPAGGSDKTKVKSAKQQ